MFLRDSIGKRQPQTAAVPKVTEQTLVALEIKIVNELRQLQVATLRNEFGRYAIRLHDLTRGIDETPVVANRPTKSISAEDTFELDVPLGETEPMIRSPARMFGLHHGLKPASPGLSCST